MRVKNVGIRVVLRLVIGIGVAVCAAAGMAAAEVQHFQSPSGNIRCVLVDDEAQYARCDLGVDQQTYTERPSSCDGGWGTSFGVTASGTGFVNCVTAAIGGPDQPQVLPYGTAAAVRGIVCTSEPTGVTCTNLDGGGFSVRRAEQRIF